MARKSRDVILLLYPHETPPRVLHLQLGSPQPKKSMDLWESREGPWRGSEGWNISPVKTGWETWVCPAWRRLLEGFIASFQCLEEVHKKDKQGNKGIIIKMRQAEEWLACDIYFPKELWHKYMKIHKDNFIWTFLLFLFILFLVNHSFFPENCTSK